MTLSMEKSIPKKKKLWIQIAMQCVYVFTLLFIIYIKILVRPTISKIESKLQFQLIFCLILISDEERVNFGSRSCFCSHELIFFRY